MIVYHGTTDVIDHPNVSCSKKYLDFGKGFYLTTFEEQAKKSQTEIIATGKGSNCKCI